jgi:ribosome-binding ATPase YchF (GTP1/OBG family)
MKICVVGIDGLSLGKHNVKDPRLDAADRLVEAKKKTYVQVDLVGEEELAEAEGVLVQADRKADLALRDLEFVETRLGREPSEAERSGLLKLQAALESEQWVNSVTLDDTERPALIAHAFVTAKPIVVAAPADLEQLEALVVRAYHECGYLSFLTVGGKENRAWSIRRGATAWDAAGVIHSDIQKGFIRAEVIGYDDLVNCGGETQAKRAGKQRLEMRPYVIQDYDVVNFRFNK